MFVARLGTIFSLVLLAVVGIVHAEEPQEKEKLQGVWVSTEVLSGGKKQEIEVTLKFVDDTVTITTKGRPAEKCTYSIAAENSPAHMDIMMERRGNKVTLPAIYEIKNVQLRICHAVRPSGARPKSLTGDADTVLFSCKKVDRKDKE